MGNILGYKTLVFKGLSDSYRAVVALSTVTILILKDIVQIKKEISKAFYELCIFETTLLEMLPQATQMTFFYIKTWFWLLHLSTTVLWGIFSKNCFYYLSSKG